MPSSLLFATSRFDPGMFSSSRRYAQVTDSAPWRIAVRLQSMPVSPPPSTTTFLFARLTKFSALVERVKAHSVMAPLLEAEAAALGG